MDTDTWVIPKGMYSARLEGACLCGVVQWSYDAPLTTMFYCHCSICRKHHGTMFAAFVAGPLATFHWRGGTERISAWQSSSHVDRSFCSTCGSKVPSVVRSLNQVFMPAGGLVGELGIRPQMHIFVGSKLSWHLLSDGLPKHDAYPPQYQAYPVENAPRAVREGATSGSCACGRVRFELDGRPLVMMHCHCSRCRRSRGTAHATNLAWKLEALKYTVGEEMLTVFDLPGAQHFGTTFCSHCGGFVPRRSTGRGWVVVPVGSLDSNPEVHPLAHQFVASKAAWFDITDGVPQFAEAAPR